MRLSADTLIAIAKKLTDLENIDVVVKSFMLNGDTILVETVDTQMEGRTYYMVGFEKGNIYTTARPIRDNPQA
jgi:hypothetical protein